MTPPLLAYYGDDFTGSADVMEVLTWAGFRTVLFLEPPTPQQLLAFEDLRAFGIAGWSRSMSPAEMDVELRPALERLKASGASIIHYKTCSTFDSSPEIGSIGRALEIGREVFGSDAVPIVIGAPNLGRYQVFGNLFARSGLDSEPCRLDRHPTMKQHPITPMTEADIRQHFAKQTNARIGLVDVLQLDAKSTSFDDLHATGDDALLFDVLYPEHLPRIGEAIQSMVDKKSPRFVIGSSGVEYALTGFWSHSNHLKALQSHAARQPSFSGTDQLVVITGSCSPVNDRQITWAEGHGFESMPLDPARLIMPETSESEIASSVERAVSLIQGGKNVILHSSRGPGDPRVRETHAAFRSLGMSDLEIRLHSGRTLGPKLGQILRGILLEHSFQRVAVAGGDTSGYVARELGIIALEALAPVAPGSPLCRVYADNKINGIEILFKGGQVGKDNVWGTMLEGTSG